MANNTDRRTARAPILLSEIDQAVTLTLPLPTVVVMVSGLDQVATTEAALLMVNHTVAPKLMGLDSRILEEHINCLCLTHKATEEPRQELVLLIAKHLAWEQANSVQVILHQARTEVRTLQGVLTGEEVIAEGNQVLTEAVIVPIADRMGLVHLPVVTITIAKLTATLAHHIITARAARILTEAHRLPATGVHLRDKEAGQTNMHLQTHMEVPKQTEDLPLMDLLKAAVMELGQTVIHSMAAHLHLRTHTEAHNQMEVPLLQIMDLAKPAAIQMGRNIR